MSRRLRRFIFYSFVLVFILVSGWLVLYASGFVVSVQGWNVEQRGAIFLRANPAGVSVYLDGVRYDSPSGILRTQAFITNLPEGYHELIITKDGYHRWQKQLLVRPLEVTEVGAVRLIPRAPRIEPYTAGTSTLPLLLTEETRRILPVNVRVVVTPLLSAHSTPQELLLSPDGKKVLARYSHGLTVVWIAREQSNARHQIGDHETLATLTEPITDALWLPGDSNHVIYAADGKVNITEVDGRGGRNTVELLTAERVKFFIDPANNGLVYADKEILYRLDL
ncbi:MAG: PEGA domain-containing protein [bacterium]|nr:PEGA domain-containing protein [bacterium]MDZ4296587.1 PEGA domain-containing protein [Patescibacteria group bacterium]